ncbi:hypothetical protein AMAG_10624 [Allomyces macrogynus ATCC 38327]|uniref:Uncharacterized protein n=1 Tax=Allomyces macrogynus (strain ATCC 38327) TaxID=578462 RepID=A0A0L0SRH5_ALLM3|nr:hypothetical protein AMAG_10624 [Allomyces macrogynus ATCC 38327]|eukprot:KNE64960.1 hypothetical protein AMAG_10624 [Allomyces macrogynus ATCC 38327]
MGPDAVSNSALIETLPFDVLEVLCYWILRTESSSLSCRATLLHLALASGSLFAPAVHAALRDRNLFAGPFLPVDWNDPRSTKSGLAQSGRYLTSLQHEGTLHFVYLVLPQRIGRRTPVSNGGPSSQYWSQILAIPLHQLAHASIDAHHLALVPIPPNCRFLTIHNGTGGSWPAHIPPAHSLALKLFFVTQARISAITSWFHPSLRELTIGVARIGNDATLVSLYDHLPPLLAVFEVIEDNVAYPSDLGTHSGAALSRALARLTQLSILRHAMLLRPDDAVHIVNGLAKAQKAGKTRLMRMVSLIVTADYTGPVAQVPLFDYACQLRVKDFVLHLGAQPDASVLANYGPWLLNLLRVVPTQLESLTLCAPMWPNQVVAQFMQRFNSPTLLSLHFVGKSWLSTGAALNPASLVTGFMLSALGPLSAQVSSLTSLTIMGCLASQMIAADHNLATWTLPPLLRALDLSQNRLSTGDIEILFPQLPMYLHELDLSDNLITSLPASFPPSLRVLSVAQNPLRLDATEWIDALPLTLRSLDIASCCLEDRMARRLLDVQRRAGTRGKRGKTRLTVSLGGNKFSADMQHALQNA